MASQIPESTTDETAPSDVGTEDQENLHAHLLNRYHRLRYGDYTPNEYTQRKYGVDDSIPEPSHDIQQEGEVPESYRAPDVFERRNADAAVQFRDTDRAAEVRAGVRHVQSQVEDNLLAGQEPSKRDLSTLTNLGARVPTPTDVAHAESQTSYNVDPNPFPEDEGDRLDMGIQFAKANDEATARDNTKETQTSYDVDPSPFPENEGDSLSMGIDFAKANDQARARDNTKDTQTDAPTYQDGGTQTDRPRVSNHRTQTQRPTVVSQGTQYNPPQETPPHRDIVMPPASILGKRRKDNSSQAEEAVLHLQWDTVGNGRFPLLLLMYKCHLRVFLENVEQKSCNLMGKPVLPLQ